MGTIFKKGFTLAEVLITLGIIGVVAAITIPILMQKTQDAELKTAWKKEYSVISQAYNLMKQDEGGDLSQYFITAGNNQTAPVIQKLGNYLAVTQSCGIPYITDYGNVCGVPSSPSLTNQYKTRSGQYVHMTDLCQGQYILKDGTQMYFRIYNSGWINIFVDVNGFNKGPNALSRDLFGISITNNWVKPMGAVGTGTEGTCNNTAVGCNFAFGFSGQPDCAGAGCSADYLYN